MTPHKILSTASRAARTAWSYAFMAIVVAVLLATGEE